MIGLLKPFETLLLDEFTVNLDIVARTDFLQFLKQETEERNATVVYATHIFEGLDDWATHVVHLSQGAIAHCGEMLNIPGIVSMREAGTFSPLLRLADEWLRQEKREKREKTRQREIEMKNQKSEEIVHAPQASLNNGFGPGRFYHYWA